MAISHETYLMWRKKLLTGLKFARSNQHLDPNDRVRKFLQRHLLDLRRAYYDHA